jgi:hypothetical protein
VAEEKILLHRPRPAAESEEDEAVETEDRAVESS